MSFIEMKNGHEEPLWSLGLGVVLQRLAGKLGVPAQLLRQDEVAVAL